MNDEFYDVYELTDEQKKIIGETNKNEDDNYIGGPSNIDIIYDELNKLQKRWKKIKEQFWHSFNQKEENDYNEMKLAENQYEDMISEPLPPDQDYDRWNRWVEYVEERLNPEDNLEPEEKQISEQKQKSIEAESQFQKKLYNFKDRFLEVFDYYSFDNQEMGEALFHSVLGTCFKDTEIFKKEKLMNFASHSIIIQNSGSGKDEALDFVELIVKDINERTEAYNKSMEEDSKLDTIKVHNLAGQETAPVLLNFFPSDNNNKAILYYNKKDFYKDYRKANPVELTEEGQKLKAAGKKVGDEKPPISGILSRSDILMSRECSHLFIGASSQSRGKGDDKVEILLQTLEGRGYEKSLVSWEGRSTITYFKGAFIGTSRPINNMKAHIAHSGFQQRGLNCLRNLTLKDRSGMFKKDIKCMLRTDKEEKEITDKRKELAKEFFNLRLFVNNNQITYDESKIEEIQSLINTQTMSFFENIVENIIIDEHREILESFVARYSQHIKKFSYHYALVRKGAKIGLSDVHSAIDCLKHFHNKLIKWIEGNIIEDREKKERRIETANLIRNIIRKYTKENKIDYIPKIELTKKLCQILRKSPTMIHNYLESFSVGKFNLLEKSKMANSCKITYKLRTITIDEDENGDIIE